MVKSKNRARKLQTTTRFSFHAPSLLFFTAREREREKAKNTQIQSNLGLEIPLIWKPNPGPWSVFPDRSNENGREFDTDGRNHWSRWADRAADAVQAPLRATGARHSLLKMIALPLPFDFFFYLCCYWFALYRMIGSVRAFYRIWFGDSRDPFGKNVRSWLENWLCFYGLMMILAKVVCILMCLVMLSALTFLAMELVIWCSQIRFFWLLSIDFPVCSVCQVDFSK